MAEVKNSFVGGRMEKDLDERLIPEGVYRDALNIDIDTDSGSNVGSARNSLGNTIVGDYTTARGMNSYDPYTDNARTIGAVKYEADNLLYWFVAADTFDGIFEYDEVNDVVTRVLVCTKASPTTDSTLRFNKRYLITGVNYIDGYLYWTDNYNPPRRINIARAKGYAIDDARIADDIDVIVKPPLDSPRILVTNDPGIQSNNMEEKFLYFSVRYKNIDGQYSAMSPFSAVAFHPGDFEFDYQIGQNKSMVNNYNTCEISFNTGDQFVKEIQLLMRDARSNNIYVVESFNKDKLSLADNITLTFPFSNNKTYGVLDPSQLGRIFDNVPIKAKAQEFVGNRLMYGNYVQFYDLKDCNGDEIRINLDVDYESSSVVLDGTPVRTWRSDRDYEVGIEYIDKYGRSTTVFTSENNTVYIPSTQSDRANSLVVNISNPPPCWATKYRLLVKSSKKEYYNVFPVTFYRNGAYRYFLINESDKDKIKVGGYVIFKTENYGPTYSNKRYKILEIDLKNSNFLPGALSGLYFKIKVDNPLGLNPDVNILSSWNFQGGTDHFNGQTPVFNAFPFVERPIYYGDNDPNVLQRVGNATSTNADKDYRITINVTSLTTFEYTTAYNYQGGWTQNQTINIGTTTTLYDGSIPLCDVVFSSQPVVGDTWKINVRGFGSGLETENYFGGRGLCLSPDGNSFFTGGATASTAFDAPGGWAPVECPGNILPGDIIRITLFDSLNPSQYTQSQSFVSNGTYENIEEWFVEDGAYSSFQNVGSIASGFQSVSFRRGLQRPELNYYGYLWSSINQIDPSSSTSPDDYPMCMIIRGNGIGESEGGNSNAGGNRFAAEIVKLRRNASLVCETVPDDNNLEVYHETTQTYDITGGVHMAVTTDSPNNVNQVLTGGLYLPAVVKLNYPGNENSDFNAWTFGNGLESDRIRDDWNATTLEYSPRVNSYVEDYRQRRSDSAICYSGIYGENTGVDKLNEFNLSIANFKYLDKEFGSIQKLHAEDTNLLVLQENKVSRVLYGKNLLSDSVGGGSIVSIPEVLGSQIPYPGEWGISNNPESFAVWGHTKWFTDQRRGAVLQMSGDAEPIPISDIGMRDHFRDLMKDQPYDQKLGGFDPDKMLYTLAYNDDSILDCELSISRDQLKIGSAAVSNLYLFTITTNVSWTVTIENNGFGTGWITALGTNSGYGIGNQDIYCNVAQNNTGAIRNVKFVVSYCDGLEKEFLLIQGRSRKGKITLMVVNNGRF